MDWSDRIGRRIRLRDVPILLAVVQRGSIARAARHLAISQPVVSKVIAELEHVLGVRLLNRDRHGAEPTIYGAALLKHGIAVFDELRQSVKEIEFLTDPTVGELRIGSTGAMGAGLLPVVISLLHHRHPRLTLHVMQSGSVAALCRELRERNLDLILGRILMPGMEDDLSADTLFDDSYLLMTGSQNRWISRRKIELADLIHEPWILPARGTAAEATVAEIFRACRLEIPRRGVVCASVQMHDALLASGPYLAMRPTSVVRFGGKHPSVKVLPVKLPVLPGPVGIITLKGRMISPVAQLFIDCVREVAKPLAKRK